MKIEDRNGILIIEAGLLFPKYELSIKSILSWELVAQENGATYFSFKYKNSTQHVSISSGSPEDVKHSIEIITEILDMHPKLDISESRVSASELFIATDVVLSVSVLALILAGGN